MQIKEIRQEKEISREELSKRTGIHSTLLWKYETGRITPGITNAQKIAEVLKCDIKDLLK